MDIEINGGILRRENKKDMPMGLVFQMSMNEKTMENFAKSRFRLGTETDYTFFA